MYFTVEMVFGLILMSSLIVLAAGKHSLHFTTPTHFMDYLSRSKVGSERINLSGVGLIYGYDIFSDLEVGGASEKLISHCDRNNIALIDSDARTVTDFVNVDFAIAFISTQDLTSNMALARIQSCIDSLCWAASLTEKSLLVVVQDKESVNRCDDIIRQVKNDWEVSSNIKVGIGAGILLT